MQNTWLNTKRWIKRVNTAVRMRRLDDRPLPPRPAGEIRLFVLARNEALRLPFFLAHYRALGVGRFFVMDNGSTDGTVEFLRAQPDVHAWQTAQSYHFRATWTDALLSAHGRGGWNVVVDTDELLAPRLSGLCGLAELTRRLDERGFDALQCLMLDMYPERPVGELAYRPGEDLLRAAPCYETESIHEIDRADLFPRCRGPIPRVPFGGMRERIFGNRDISLSKFPLLRYGPGVYVGQGFHSMEGAAIAPARGALLHFKYLQDFAPRVEEEVVRGEHYDGASQYRIYQEGLRRAGKASFVYEKTRRLSGWDEEIACDLLHTPPWLR